MQNQTLSVDSLVISEVIMTSTHHTVGELSDQQVDDQFWAIICADEDLFEAHVGTESTDRTTGMAVSLGAAPTASRPAGGSRNLLATGRCLVDVETMAVVTRWVRGPPWLR